LDFDEGPDPAMSLVVVADQNSDDAALREGAEWCVRRYAEPAALVNPDQDVPIGEHISLILDADGRKSFFLNIDTAAPIGLFAQHTAEEFDLQLKDAHGAAIQPVAERTWVAQHEHDDEVGSIAIEADGDVDQQKLNLWLSDLLRERGVDIFRMKGFISLAGESERFVFQGVHMLFDGQPDRPWGDDPRRNQLVFIGRNLDEEGMRQGFEACLM
ncbi:MAG: GTP-binding protein, partial [Pseudomonadota bacterium]